LISAYRTISGDAALTGLQPVDLAAREIMKYDHFKSGVGKNTVKKERRKRTTNEQQERWNVSKKGP